MQEAGQLQGNNARSPMLLYRKQSVNQMTVNAARGQVVNA